jgi:hypothetical protein
MQENIIWKPILGFEGYYEISNNGLVKRAKGKTIYKDGRIAFFSETILKPSINKKGYLSVYLSKNSKKHTLTIHRIVAIAFIENINNKPQVNHIDGDKKNNSVSNLEWCTNEENRVHAVKNGLTPRGIKHFSAKINDNDVINIRQMFKDGNTAIEIKKHYPISIKTIYSIKYKNTWKHL